ncbi:MAG: hypothetical protein QGH60_02850 [Phycisphaerae bacterium]|nr:hypothetical protein [Phycisphaerae bacterium]
MMLNRTMTRLSLLIVTVVSTGAVAAEKLPENLARKAKVSASSQFSGQYRASSAIDGDAAGSDWAVKGTQSGEFTLQWKKEIEATQVVYFARTTGQHLESFKDYEVYLNDAKEPAVKGKLEMRHGPQLINFTKQKVTKIRIKFLTSHPNSLNSGAAEIGVYATPITKKQLGAMAKRASVAIRVPASKLTEASKALRKDLIDGKLGFKDILLVKRHPLNISHVYVYHVEGYIPGGGLYIYTADEEGGKVKCIYDAKQGMITTADLSYDGKEIVFAMKTGGMVRCNPMRHAFDIPRDIAKNNYQIWRINIDGTGLTQLTSEKSNNLDPCWLPDGGVAFISDRKPAYAYCYVVTSPVVYRMDRDGKKQKRLSANYLMDFTPSVSNDGRIVYTRWEYVDRAACPIQSLWTMNPDGTGLAGLYGNRVISPGTFMDAQPVPGKKTFIATATNHNGPCRGGIVLIDPTMGANNLKAITNLTPEIALFNSRGVYGNGLRGPYEKPMPVGGDKFLVSNNGLIELRDFDCNKVPLAKPNDRMGFYSPQPVVAMKTPPLIVGTPMNRDVALHADGSVTGNWATVFMQDVYNGLEPHVKRGEITQIAVIQELEKSTHTPQDNFDPYTGRKRKIAAFGFQFPLVSCGATYAAKKVWGFANVDKDGRAAFQVPAEVPIYFMALDKEGRAVQRMRSFTHFMPGEKQGCVGCHADRNSAAPRLGAKRIRSKPQELIKPAWGVKGFTYAEVVQPVFDKHCIKCHNERKQDGKVDLSGDKTDFFNVSYDILARTGTMGMWKWRLHGSPIGPKNDSFRGMSPYTEWIWSINGSGHNTLLIAPYRWGSPASKLAKIIHSGHPDKKGKKMIDVPLADRKRVYIWIDLNVPYYGTSSSNHKKRIGSRRMYPPKLDSTLSEVAKRRCNECHKGKIPRKFYTRFENPQNNGFLLAPLAKSAGGTEKCGKAIFKSTDDPDYQKIIKTFDTIHELLRKIPRADMKNFTLLTK